MKCFNCRSQFTLYIEQNSMYRLCVACGRFICLLCGNESHFPAYCSEMENYQRWPQPDIRNLFQAADNWIANNDALILEFGGLDALFFLNPDLHLLACVINTVVRFLKYLRVASPYFPEFFQIMEDVEEELVDALHVLMLFPQPSRDERKEVALAVIGYLNRLLAARQLLGNCSLLSCIPTFPRDLIPPLPNAVGIVNPDGSGFFGKTADSEEIEGIFASLLYRFSQGQEADVVVADEEFDGSFPSMEEFMEQPHVLDRTRSPQSVRANMATAIYAEILMWSLTIQRR